MYNLVGMVWYGIPGTCGCGCGTAYYDVVVQYTRGARYSPVTYGTDAVRHYVCRGVGVICWRVLFACFAGLGEEWWHQGV